MDWSRIARITLMAVVATLLIASVTGCQRAAERAVEGVTGVRVEDDGDTVTMQTDEGEMTISGSETSLPDDWPSDMPVHGDGTIESSSSVRQQDQVVFSVSWSTSDNFDEVHEWYTAEVVSNGWAIENDLVMEQSGEKTSNMFLKKGEREAWVFLSRPPDGPTGIAIQVQGP